MQVHSLLLVSYPVVMFEPLFILFADKCAFPPMHGDREGRRGIGREGGNGERSTRRIMYKEGG